MPWVHQPIFVLHADPRMAARVECARPYTTHTVRVDSWPALREAAATAAPGSLAVVDPRFGRPDGTLSPALRTLCAAFPALPVLAVTRLPPGGHGDALTLGRWGVAALLRAGSDDRGAALSARLHTCYDDFAIRVSAAVAEHLHDPQQLLVLHLASMAALRAEPADWAELFDITETRLAHHTREQALPTPKRMLAWGRVLLAADLLGSPGHTVATVAAACGYAGVAPLRRVVRRLTGLTPSGLAARPDPLRAAAARFAREVMGRGGLPEGR